ncbi:MAG TPA: cytochrome c, partial [Bacteroidia bacterium]|nr:cytochrome c [Bacteroidia bacterium]
MHQKLTNNLLVKCKGLFFMLLILGISLGVKAQDGKALFDANCKSCHAMNDVVIGPALKNVHKKFSAEWLHKWIKNSQALVKAGDKDAVAVFNEFNKMVMPNQNLSDAEIDAVLAYIGKESEQAPVAAAPTAPAPGTVTPEKDNSTLYWVIAIFLILLNGCLFFFIFPSSPKNQTTGIPIYLSSKCTTLLPLPILSLSRLICFSHLVHSATGSLHNSVTKAIMFYRI